MLLIGSDDDLCLLLPAQFQVVAYLLPAVSLPAFLAICLVILIAEISSLPLPPSLVHFQLPAFSSVC
jgi:membrane protein YdbS with pleckstrin-like domain